MQGVSSCSAACSGVAADRDGNVVSVGGFSGSMDLGNGTVTSVANSPDAFVAKYNRQGGLLWVKRFGNTGGDSANGVVIDSQDNIIVTGCFQGTVDFGGGPLTSAGGYDIFVAKFNSANPPSLLWAKRFGGTWDERGTAVAIATNNDIFIAATLQSLSADFGSLTLGARGNNDIAVAKLDHTDGHTLWAKSWGGTDNDKPAAIAVDLSGNLWVAGEFYGTTDLGNGPRINSDPRNLKPDMFLAKYSGVDGSHLYSRTMGDINTDRASGIAVDPVTGNIIITGSFQGTMDFGGGSVNGGSGGGTTMFVAGYGPSGNWLWQQSWGGSILGCQDQGMALSIDRSGNLALAGTATSSMYLGGSWVSGGGYIIVSFTMAGDSPPLYRWCKRADLLSGGSAVAFDTFGHVVTGGQFTSTTDFGGMSAGILTEYPGAFVAQHSNQ